MFPIAFVFMMSVMGGYAKDYEGAVQATNEMSSSMIEYINGIEVIKAFNQGKTSYARLAEKVRANAQYYFDWMRRSQLGMSMAYAFFPAQMLTVLPFGWLFYTHGTLTAEAFVTVIILALGMAAPIVAAFNFVDTLALVGTTVSQVDEILKAEEQPGAGPLLDRHAEQIAPLEKNLALGHLEALVARQHRGQRALARAVRPHDRMDLAGTHRQIDSLQYLLAVDSGMQIFHFQHSIYLMRPARLALAHKPEAR